MQITERGSSQVQCAEQNVSQYSKPYPKQGSGVFPGGSRRWGGEAKSF